MSHVTRKASGQEGDTTGLQRTDNMGMGAGGETGKEVMHLRLCLSAAVSMDLAKTPWEKQPENE